MSYKSEARISPNSINWVETNSNDRNNNDQNVKPTFQSAIVLNFEHSNFDIVSNFGFRYSNFISPL
jgi:hypothetical protein